MSVARGVMARGARALASAAISGALVAACGGAQVTPQAPVVADDGTAGARLARLEDEILGDLAAIDLRLAARAERKPSDADLRRVALAAILAEESSTATVDGAIDPFSFDARARGLAAVKAKLAAAPKPTPSIAREHLLLTRLVEAELARVEEERALPRSASDLVRAVVATWRTPPSLEAVDERDGWLARRLREVRESLGGPGLDTTRARELDDALDDLEEIIREQPFKQSTAELVRLRDALEGASGANAPIGWAGLRARLRAHFGVDAARAEDLVSGLTRARAAAAELAGKVKLYGESERDALGAQMDGVLYPRALCRHESAASRIGALYVSPERAPLCHLTRGLAERADVPTSLAVAMHTYVTVGLWAMDLATRNERVSEASARHPLLYPPTTKGHARAERLALARPATAIGTALGVAMLLKEGPIAGARRLAALGDAPLDLTSAETPRPPPPPRASLRP